MVILDADIRRAVAPRAFDAGQRLQRDGDVRTVKLSADSRTVKAEVTEDWRTFRQHLSFVPTSPAGLFVSGSCTCGAGGRCKHVAAVLFDLRTRDDAAPPSDDEAPLPYDVDAWLRSLAAAREEDSEDYPPGVRKRLLYVLDRAPHLWTPQPGGLTVSLQSVELKRDGTTQGATRHQLDQLLRAAPKFLRPADRAILNRLAGLRADDGEAMAAVVRAIVATGRGRWATWTGPVLAEGPPVPGEVDWQVADDGTQKPGLSLPAPLLLLRLPNPWYVNPANGTVGPVETSLPPRLLAAMLNSPALPPATANRVRAEMARRLPGEALPAPKPVDPPAAVRAPLQPHLLLLSGHMPFDLAGSRHQPGPPGELRDVPMARLSWRYSSVTLPSGPRFQPVSTVQEGGKLFAVHRNRAAEERAADRVEALGLSRIPSYLLPPSHPHGNDLVLMDPDPSAWIELLLSDVPKLRDEGWQVDIAPDFPLRVVEPDGGLDFEITEGSGLDWFDLDLGVFVGGERINLVPALLDVIADAGTDAVLGLAAEADDADVPLLLPLPDGRLLSVPLAQIQPILAPLLELFAGAGTDGASGTLRLSRANAGDLALLEAAGAEGVTWSGGEAVRTLGRQLREHGGIPPVATPPGFGAELRPYQAHGLAWLQFLRTAGMGGVLADDMGLGKTVQALAHLAVEQDGGRLDRPALVVCPTSLVPNWAAEAARFAPSLRLLVLHGPDRASRFGAIGEHDLVVTTYPLLARDHAVLTEQEWHVVVLDEAQTIKNPQATTSKLARGLQARQRLCLSGTPLENHLGELWSLFDFLLPGFLGDRRQFGARYRGPIEKAGNTERQAMLAQRVAPFLLRRTKDQVAPELPPKTEIAETVEMGEGQRALYDAIRLAMHAKVRQAVAKRGLAGSGIVILDALLKLRQACCDPRLVKLDTARKGRAKSAKLERLLELLPPMLEDGRRVLLFSQFTSMLALIEEELKRLGLPYVLLTGDTRDRAGPIGQFQSGAVPLFLISLKAGGTGLNLTAADTVIHYDPWWNPAVENQATDRAHRIGQDKPVFVHRLVTAGTVEEKMQVLKERKQALADGILAASADAAATLTEGDLDMLFAA